MVLTQMSNPEENKQSIYIDRDGVEMGPFSHTEVNQYLDEGRLTIEDYGWIDGMEDWRPICSVPGIKPPLATPPPHLLLHHQRPRMWMKSLFGSATETIKSLRLQFVNK